MVSDSSARVSFEMRVIDGGLMVLMFVMIASAEVTLTVYYDFEGSGDDRLNDPAGDFADDMINFNVTFPSEAPDGGGVQSAYFNGNAALFTNVFTTDLGPDPDSYTVMMWVKGTDADQENSAIRILSTTNTPDETAAADPDLTIGGFGNSGSAGRGLAGYIFSSEGAQLKSPGAWYRDETILTGDKRVGAVANTGQIETWRHIAVVFSNSGDPSDGGAYAESYIDGRSAGITSADASWDGQSMANTQGQLILGSYKESGTVRDFIGYLDEVAMFAGVMSLEDINAIYEGTKSPADWLPDESNAEVVAAAMEFYYPNESNESVIGFDADPDEDGRCNAMEILFGTDPSVGDFDESIFEVSQVESEGEFFLQLQLVLDSVYVQSLNWRVEWSSDLATWTESSNEEVTIHDTGGFTTLTVLDDQAENYTRYVRLKIDLEE